MPPPPSFTTITMPARISFYRPTGQSRRQVRQTHDHDVFEGLPVRRWHREWVGLGPPSATTSTAQLQLPKDAHLLSCMSQGLLTAARDGSSKNMDDTAKPRETVAAEPRFRTKRWVRYPQDQEPPEPVYLYKAPGDPGRKVELQSGVGATPATTTTTTRRRVPPPPKKKTKRPGRKPVVKKSVTFAGEEPQSVAPDVEMLDVDPASLNEVAMAIEEAENTVEAVVLEQQKGDGHGHALPVETTTMAEVKTE
ncbi:hypothetical protein FN846DRAFT_901943 [Sphaerosporella brunnea]|uniref:Uncharacterized protein n=1 Tax=Sphaerosporella brunnea TaxID=1250544 RepID=A0A5J5FBM8_9PEZI|nr:hypothetical protein FN846DRAFT_901943 [Sphaerosporella brunnea]